MNSKKIMITGGRGMLGRQITDDFKSEHTIYIADIDDTDITDLDRFHKFTKEINPDIIIHAAAYTRVDGAETESDFAYKLNALGSKNVAVVAEAVKAKIIYISTDYVFDGVSSKPYNEYDTPNPTSVYGKSKYAGEVFVKENSSDYLITRISWLYGLGGPSFLHTMNRLSVDGVNELKVVNDQIGNPTSTIAVSRKLKSLINSDIDLKGIFHLTCEGSASWYDLAVAFFKLRGFDQKVTPCSSLEYKTPAKRPANSQLDKMNLRLHNLEQMPNWQDALKEFVDIENW